MRVSAALVLAATVAAGPAPGQALSKLQKIYFGSTKPGSWARYEQTTTDKGGKVSTSEMTIARLDNEDGKAWFEIHIVPKTGSKGKPTTMRYLMKPEFPVEKNALDYTKYIDRVIIQQEGQKAQEMPWQTVRTMFGGSLGYVDYGGSLTSKGTETVDGRSCDHYAFSGPFEVKVAFISMKGTTEGDIWLNEGVPFGRVKESSSTKDESGKVISRSEMKLLETGTGAKTRITGPIEKAPDMPDFGKAFGKS